MAFVAGKTFLRDLAHAIGLAGVGVQRIVLDVPLEGIATAYVTMPAQGEPADVAEVVQAHRASQGINVRLVEEVTVDQKGNIRREGA